MVKFFFSNNKIMSFGVWLRNKRKLAGFSQEKLAELATASGHSVTGAYISNLERSYDKNKKGLPTRPNEDLVETLAKVMNLSINEAREQAGYAPKYKNETIQIAEGVKVIVEDNFSEEQKQRLVDAIRLVARGVQTEGEIIYRPVTIEKIYETGDITFSEQTDETEFAEKTLKEKVKK